MFSFSLGHRPGLKIQTPMKCPAWNVVELSDAAKEKRAALAGNITNAAVRLGLAQRWGMFAPHPSVVDGYPIVAARRGDGEVLDVFVDPPRPVTREKPASIMQHFPSYRWRKYFNRVEHLEPVVLVEAG